MGPSTLGWHLSEVFSPEEGDNSPEPPAQINDFPLLLLLLAFSIWKNARSFVNLVN